jgi:hypothetical protein
MFTKQIIHVFKIRNLFYTIIYYYYYHDLLSYYHMRSEIIQIVAFDNYVDF